MDKWDTYTTLYWSISNACNFNCEYCIKEHNRTIDKTIQKVNINKIIKVIDNTKKQLKITLSGGEPFLLQNIVELSEEITKNHVLSITTNLSSDKIFRFFDTINPEKVRIIASAHFFELEKRSLLDKFISNYKYGISKGFTIYCNIVGYPGYLSKLDYYLNILKKNKINFKFIPYFGLYNKKKYPEQYSNEELKIFNLTRKELNLFKCKNKICPAGKEVLMCNSQGDIYRCFAFMFSKDNKISNIYEKIEFTQNFTFCTLENYCPVYSHDKNILGKYKGNYKVDTFFFIKTKHKIKKWIEKSKKLTIKSLMKLAKKFNKRNKLIIKQIKSAYKKIIKIVKKFIKKLIR